MTDMLQPQEQPIPGIQVGEDEDFITMYYPDFQGQGEHIVQWEREYDDDGNPLPSWRPVDFGSPESFLRIHWNSGGAFERRIQQARASVQ